MALKHLFMIGAAACAAIASGCALMAPDCASDWYEIGARDGRLGAQPQAQLYAASCAGKVDAARYLSGWRAGFDERPIPLW